MEKFKTRHELASELGMSYSTFWRKIKQYGIKVSKGLLSPYEQKNIIETLNYVEQNSQKNNDKGFERF